MQLDPDTLARIETPEQAEAAFALLQELADAVQASPGCRDLIDRRITPLTTEELRAVCASRSVELGVIMHHVGLLLRGEATARDVRTLAHKLCCMSHWSRETMDVDRDLRGMSDAAIGELLKGAGITMAEAESAAVRHPGPGASFNTLRDSDAY